MTHQPQTPQAKERWTRGYLAFVFGLFIVWLLRYVLLPFVAAGALAFVAGPMIRWMQRRWGWPRWIAGTTVFLLYLVLFSGLGYGAARAVVPEFKSIIADLPQMLRQFLRTLFGSDQIQLMGKTQNVNDIVDQLRASFAHAPATGSDVIDAVGISVAAMTGVVLTIVLLLYFLLDGPRLAQGMLWLVPPALRPRVQIIAGRSGPIINRYIVGVFVVVLYTTLITWIVTHWVLHLKHALVLALAVGLLEMIPVLGPILSLMLIAFAAIEQIKLWTIIGLAIFAIGLRLSIDQLVGPIVLGRAVKLPAPLIIFAFLAGGILFGPLGVILAIPAVAVGKIAMEEGYGDENSMNGHTST